VDHRSESRADFLPLTRGFVTIKHRTVTDSHGEISASLTHRMADEAKGHLGT
jgi:hypothetical protein